MNKTYKYLALVMAIVVIWACKKDEDPVVESVVQYDPTPYELDFSYLPPPMIPEDNPMTQAGVQLGKMLFYEKRLSDDNSLSCAGCHLQEDAFSDLNQFSTGTAGLPGGRQAMGVINMLWNNNGFFWDGRAELLRHQSLMPIQDPLEMNQSLDDAIAKISGDQMYRDQFKRAFGSEEINEEKMSLAMEQFMFSLISVNSKYDRYILGLEELTASELNGLTLFQTEYNPGSSEVGADCVHCHSGFNFHNNQYMNNGLDEEADFSDLGRFDVTGLDEDKAKFKVTTLRNIELTPPYMHDGRFNTLEEVIDHYDSGIKASSTLDPAIENTMATGLGLSDSDKADIVAFLKTLTDDSFITNPAFENPFE